MICLNHWLWLFSLKTLLNFCRITIRCQINFLILEHLTRYCAVNPFFFWNKVQTQTQIHGSPWIFVSYWNCFLEFSQLFWPCLDSTINLIHLLSVSGPLNNFLCMESSRKLCVYKKFCLKHGFILVDIPLLCLYETIGLVPNRNNPITTAYYIYWHFYSCTWMKKLVLILIMVTILKRSAPCFLWALVLCLPHIILNFNCEVIFVGSVEMVWCERQGYYEARVLERNITTTSAAVSTPCWLCQPLPVHDGDYSTCIFFTSCCLVITYMVFF